MKLTWVGVLAIILLAWPGTTGTTKAATVTIEIRDFFFTPTNVSVFLGDTITWTNRGITSHDTTQGAATTPDAQRLWKSPNLLAASGNFKYTFTNAGTFPYVCLQHISTHPQQTGTVSVVGGNIPPSVAMTAPAGGSRHPAPPNFLASATASDPDGTVTNVFFIATASAFGTVNVGSASTPPYSVLVTNLPPASYQFRAVAMDDGGLSTTSSVVNVLIAVPAALQLTSANTNGSGLFQFDMSTTLGLIYVVEEAPSVEGPWRSVLTNSGPTSPPLKISLPYLDGASTQRVYRAFIQP